MHKTEAAGRRINKKSKDKEHSVDVVLTVVLRLQSACRSTAVRPERVVGAWRQRAAANQHVERVHNEQSAHEHAQRHSDTIW